MLEYAELASATLIPNHIADKVFRILPVRTPIFVQHGIEFFDDPGHTPCTVIIQIQAIVIASHSISVRGADPVVRGADPVVCARGCIVDGERGTESCGLRMS